MRVLTWIAAFWLMALPGLAQSTAFASFEAASEPVLNDPHDLAIGPDGLLYIADKFGNRVVVMDPDSLEIVRVIGDGLLPGAHDVSFNADGMLAVSATSVGRVFVLDPANSGALKYSVPAARTEGAEFHSDGRLYATSAAFGAVIAFEDQTPVALVEGGHFGVHDIAEAPDGTLWIADTGGRRLVQYSTSLERLAEIDHPKFGFLGPRYLDIDPFGRIVVADQDAHRVLMIDPKGPDGGTLLGIIGDGKPGLGPNRFDDPEGVAIFGNRYFFADSDNNRIVRYSVVMN